MSTERSEAMEAIDRLASEIHAIYGRHLSQAGITAPSWENLSDSEKSISRDISRLVLLKMQEAYSEGQKNAAQWYEIFKKAVESVYTKVEQAILLSHKERRVAVNPIFRGIEEAILSLSRKLTIDILGENPEILSRFRSWVEEEVMKFISSRPSEKED